MISRALLNAPFFIPKDADLLRNRKINTKKRQNRHLPELAFLILGTYFTAPKGVKESDEYKMAQAYNQGLRDAMSIFEREMKF